MHVQQNFDGALVRIFVLVFVEGVRRRRRNPAVEQMKVVKKDIKMLEIPSEVVLYKMWIVIHKADPCSWELEQGLTVMVMVLMKFQLGNSIIALT